MAPARGEARGLAALPNLRLMLASGVDPKAHPRLDQLVARPLPFRFVGYLAAVETETAV